MAYRVGRHWGVTIVRKGNPPYRGLAYPPGHPQPQPDELVAVVVNGDQALAERICLLLNGEDRTQAEPVRDGSGPHRLHSTCVDVSADDEPPGFAWICVDACRAEARPKVYHQAEHPGSDSLGYGLCTGCGEMWPCMAYRGERS
jgi:hypothetical protein